MDEEITTTPAAPAEAAVEQTQPAEQSAPEVPEQPAASEPSETSPAATEEQSAPEADEQLQKFAQSQGIDLDSPSAIKAAQIAMKARSEATRNYQKASELEKATTITQEQLPQDATQTQVDNARLRNMELTMQIQGWKMQNADKLALEGEMVKVLADPAKKELVQAGYLSLDDVYALAKANAPDNSAEVRSQASQETLQRLAQKQQAAVPTGHATNQATGPAQKKFEELSIAEMEQKLGFVR